MERCACGSHTRRSEWDRIAAVSFHLLIGIVRDRLSWPMDCVLNVDSEHSFSSGSPNSFTSRRNNWLAMASAFVGYVGGKLHHSVGCVFMGQRVRRRKAITWLSNGRGKPKCGRNGEEVFRTPVLELEFPWTCTTACVRILEPTSEDLLRSCCATLEGQNTAPPLTITSYWQSTTRRKNSHISMDNAQYGSSAKP